MNPSESRLVEVEVKVGRLIGDVESMDRKLDALNRVSVRRGGIAAGVLLVFSMFWTAMGAWVGAYFWPTAP